MSDRVGEQFGNYRLIRFLGEGSFAEVYLGRHIYLDKQAAVKVLKAQVTGEGEQDFLKEAQTIANLTHPHIVEIIDCDIEQRTPFLVMKYAPNGTLRERHSEGIPQPPSVILPYVQQVADALQYAHDKKFIHRDVKPGNMLLGPHNEVWLSDFGLALIAHSTASLSIQVPAGSPVYMAPEQFDGRTSRASDQYALAIAVYEWLCGSRPFRGSYKELEYQHKCVPPPALHEKVPQITSAVEEVVLIALAKDPNRRFASVLAFANALEQACTLEPYMLPATVFDLAPSFPAGPDPLDSAGPTLAAVGPWPAQQESLPATSNNAPSSAKAPAALAKSLPSSPVETPVSTPPAQLPARPTGNISRRRVIAGIIGTVAIIGGGALALERFLQGSTGASPGSSVITVTPAPSKAVTTPPPKPAVGTLLYKYSGPSGIKAVAWSPDGKDIAVAPGNTVQVWNPTNNQTLLSYKGHTDIVKSVAWSSDGQYIASGSQDKSVRVWNAMTGQDLLPAPYRLHTQTVRSVAWSPNKQAQLIASGSEDSTVHIWMASTGSDIIPPYKSHTNLVIGVAWSPDGKSIASASFDGTVRVWNATTGQDVLSPLHHSSGVRGVCWSPDGRSIASGGDDRFLYMWDARTGLLMQKYPTGLGNSIQTVAWSPDGSHLAVGSFDRNVQIWNIATGQLAYTYGGHKDQVWSVAWFPSLHGQTIVSGSVDGTAQVWQAI